MGMKPSLHHILFLRMPLALAICSAGFLATLFFVPFSITYVAVALVVGVVHTIVSIDELTGGRTLTYFSLPIITIGHFIARAVAFGDVMGSRWALAAQFMAIVLSTDSALTIMFRSSIESFCNRQVSRQAGTDAKRVVGPERRERVL
jgi:hypothetical protein